MRPSVVAGAFIGLVLSGSGPDRSPINGSQSGSQREGRTAAPPTDSDALPDALSDGTKQTIAAYRASASNFRHRDPGHFKRLSREVEHIVQAGKDGRDVIAEKRGFFWRGYPTQYAPYPEIYSIYVPRSYDEKKKWPLIVSLHGGSSNHNVWMAMLLGHPLTPSEYRRNFRTPFDALVHQEEAVIVAPQGMGQNHWLGEAQKDVMDVVEDVCRNYHIDMDRIFLNGLSNGAVASYKIGLDRAWRFAAVLPMSGFVDWESHALGGGSGPVEQTVLRNASSLTIAENAFNTHFVFYHGVKDSGFNVRQARRFDDRLSVLRIPHQYKEIPHLGHHLTHLLWSHMQILSYVKQFRRDPRPREIRIVATSERASRQFWATIDDRENHQAPGRLTARIDDDIITVKTENVRRFTLRVGDAPAAENPSIQVDGEKVSIDTLGSDRKITLVATTGADTGWAVWDGAPLDPWAHKRARLSGPIGDAAWEPQVHVFGTLVGEDTEILKRAAELGAKGWTPDPEFTQVRHPVVPDTKLTAELIDKRVLVLYGNARNNAILKVIGDRLPIRVGEGYIGFGEKRFSTPDVGARFISPNPLRPDGYVVVQAGVSAEAVERGGNLPIFLPDYVIFDKRFRHPSPRMVFGGLPIIESGYFTESWMLPKSEE